MDRMAYVASKVRLDAALRQVTPLDCAIKLSTEFYCELAMQGLLDSFHVDDADDGWEITTYMGFLVSRAGDQDADHLLTRSYPCNLLRHAGKWVANGEDWRPANETAARTQ